MVWRMAAIRFPILMVVLEPFCIWWKDHGLILWVWLAQPAETCFTGRVKIAQDWLVLLGSSSVF
jgi:hypothetical protein